ncbi:MAG: FtsX-like permease family protein [Anaerolineales bacterium]|jgi:putative ABC transport system permease protein
MTLGVALGVAVIVAIDLANQSASTAFSISREALTGRTTHQIIGGPTGVNQDLYEELRIDRGIRSSAPVIESIGTSPDFDIPLRILGVDPIAEAPFRDYLPLQDTGEPGFEAFFLDPNAVIISEALAKRYGLYPGAGIRIQVNESLELLRVVGVVDPADGRSSQGLEDVLLMDVGSAQQLLGMEGRLTRIDLILKDGEAEEIKSWLPMGVQVIPASDQEATLNQLTDAFELNLQALSLLALVVGMFLIYNTTMFSVIKRREIFGILRTLGATAEQILILILIEASLVAAVGSVIGLGLGVLLGRGAVTLVSQTINDFYFLVNVREVKLGIVTILKGLGGGLLAAVIASLGPAIEAARVSPVVALQRSNLEARAGRWSRSAALGGLVLISIGTLVLLIIKSSLIASFAGLFLLLIGLAALVPAVTVFTMRSIRPLLSTLAGPLGRMASGTVVRSLSRTGVAVAALMVSLSVAIGVGIMIASFRSTVVDWLGLTLRADIYVSAPVVSGTRPTASLPRELVGTLQAVPGVDAVESVRTVTVQSDLGEVLLLAVDARQQRDARLYRFAAGSADQTWQKVLDGAVIVSEPFAYRYGIPPEGGELSLVTDRGEHTFDVVGVYYDYSAEQGTVLMSQEVYRSYWDDDAISSLAVFTSNDIDSGQTAQLIRSALAGSGLQVQLNRELREQALMIFDRTFLITSALRILAIVVAFIGVMSALMALLMERAREFATMQALGLTGVELWKLIFMETGLMGATAGLLSFPTGVILAVVLIYVINLRSFGWTIAMSLNPWIFLGAFATAVVAALVAGIYPGFRLVQLPVADNLRGE